MGGHLIIKKDYEGEDVEDEVVIEAMRVSRKRILATPIVTAQRLLRRSKSGTSGEIRDSEPGTEKQRIDSLITTVKEDEKSSESVLRLGEVSTDEYLDTTASPSIHTRPTTWKRVKQFSYELLRPAPITILFSLPIALIDPLKALFVPVSDTFRPAFRPLAPDGAPPLAFILDTATFAGNASVPVGLICIGSALARLQISSARGWASRPRGAILALAIGKMIIMPIIGAGVVAGFVKCGILNKEDKVLQFVCLLMSGLPTATSQVFFTQVYNPTGSAEHLAAFLIPQYIIVFFSMTGLIVHALSYIS